MSSAVDRERLQMLPVGPGLPTRSVRVPQVSGPPLLFDVHVLAADRTLHAAVPDGLGDLGCAQPSNARLVL